MICDLCDADYDGEHTAEQCEENLRRWISEVEREAEAMAESFASDLCDLRAKLRRVTKREE